MPKRIPPAYENLDGSNCVQCVLRGILEYFEPEKSWTWEDLNELSGRTPGKLPWPFRRQINIAKRGYETVLINHIKIDDYIDNGIYETMVKHLGKDTADYQKENSDLEQVMADLLEYRALMQAGKAKRIERVPTLQDMQDFLKDGYLLACALNSDKLRNREFYSPHLVLVYDIDDTHVHFHDSGRPLIANDKVDIDHFVAACTNPTPEQWSLYAYKKP